MEEGWCEVTDVEERLEEIIRVGKYLVLVKILRKQAPCERSCWHGKATAGEKFEIPGGVRKQLPCAAHEEKLPLYVCVWGYGTSLPMNSINSFNSINIINHINYFKQTKTLQKKNRSAIADGTCGELSASPYSWGRQTPKPPPNHSWYDVIL